MPIGLVLEGGGMRGIFTAGVLDFFLDKNITFNNCIGVSAGACHACSFLSGQRGRALHVCIDYLQDKRYCSMYSLITTGDLFGVDFVYHEIPEKLYKIDNDFFKQNPCSFQAAITNCETGKAEYPYIKDMKNDVDIVRASSSLPLVSRIVMLNGKPYLDGGIADAIPLRQSILEGYAKNVVVLTQPRDYQKSALKFAGVIEKKYKKYPKLVEVIKNRHNIYNQTLTYIAEEEKKGNAFVIAPATPLGLGRIEKDKNKLTEAYEKGYKEAQNAYQALKEFMTK